MKQVKIINCTYKNMDHSKSSRYIGKILLDKDGSFEGIITDVNTKNSFLTFGHHRDDSTFHIIRGVKEENRYPHEICARKVGNKYSGEASIKASFADFPIGSGEVRILETATKSRKEAKEEIKSLDQRISLLKTSMSKTTEEVYERYMSNQLKKEKVKSYF